VRLHDNWTAGSQLAVAGLHLFSGKIPVPGAPKDSSTLIRDLSRKQRVLVVDDEQLIAESLRDILTQAGFDAVSALSGTEGIELAEQICPDIVISDVIMPDLDGVQTAIRIRRACPNARIILFSGQAATSEILGRARAEGHDFDLLPKPIHPARLLAVIRKML
jgi:DNA-binding response OmpR family regulator